MIKKSLIFILLMICVLLCGCFDFDDELIEIERDKEIDYIAYSSRFIVIDHKEHFVEDLVESAIKNGNTELRTYGFVADDNYAYFYCGYKAYGEWHFETKEDGSKKVINNTSCDVALLKLDLQTAICEIIYDFKKVLPMQQFQYSAGFVFHYIDENTLLFIYNGKIELFDIETKTILHSYHIYDENVYKNSTNVACGYKNKDCYTKDGNILHYYDYEDRDYVYHKFELDPLAHYHMIVDDYIVTYNFDFATSYTYFDCFNVKTGVNDTSKLDEVINIVENGEPQTYYNEYLNFNDSKYYVERDGRNQIKIVDEEDNVYKEVSIDDLYYGSNNLARAILLTQGKYKPSSIEVFEWFIYDNRLFVVLSEESVPYYSFLVEYDIESDIVSYEGFFRAEGEVIYGFKIGDMPFKIKGQR